MIALKAKKFYGNTRSHQAKTIVFSDVSTTGMTIGWTNGLRSNRLVVVRAGSKVNSNPVDNTTYTANTVFGSGSEIGTDNFVVYKGTGSSVTISGLSADTVYFVKVFEFSGSAGSEHFDNDNYLGNPAFQFTFNSEYQAVIDYATTNGYTKPTSSEQILQNYFLKAWKLIGAWDYADRLWMTDRGSENFSFINWKSPGAGTLLQKQGTCSWTDGSGISGNGTTGYHKTQYIPNTHGSQLTQNDTGFILYIPTEEIAGAKIAAGGLGAANADSLHITPKTTGNTWNSRVNNTTVFTTPNFRLKGFYHLQRTGSAVTKMFKDGNEVYTGTDASTARCAVEIYLNAGNGNGTAANFFTAGVGFAQLGASCQRIEMLMHIVFNAYKSNDLDFFKALFVDNYQSYEGIFVSSSGSGTGDGSYGDPYTIDQVDIASLANHTVINFKRGETFDIGFAVTKPLTFRAYGTGAKPILRGSEDISGLTWTHDGSNIYYAVPSSEPKTIFVNGIEQKKSETAFIAITDRGGVDKLAGSTATLNALNAVESLVGAEIAAKEYSWNATRKQIVTAYTSGTGELTCDAQIGLANLTLDPDKFAPAVGMPFKLFNKKSFISAVGDWCFDSGTGRVYIKTSGSAPTGIRSCVYDYGLELSADVEYVKVDGIEFREYFLEAIWSMSNNYLQITNCRINDIHQNGVSFRGDSIGVVFNYNEIQRVSGNAIHLGGITDFTINYNRITNIGNQSWFSTQYYHDVSQPGYVEPSIGLGCGITSNWDSDATVSVPTYGTIQYNTITNTGYSGMLIIGTNHEISYNVIHRPCLKWTDGGGIYFVHRAFGTGAATSSINVNHNIISGLSGTAETIDSVPYLLFIVGIYLDNGSNNITADTNYVNGSLSYCIFINYDTDAHIVTNNVMRGSGDGLIGLQQDVDVYENNLQGVTVTWPDANGHIVEGNILASYLTTTPCIHILSADGDANYDPFASGGSCDNNRYINPYSSNIAKHISTSYTLTTWRTKMGDDAASTAYTGFQTYTTSIAAQNEVQLRINRTFTAITDDVPDTSYTDKDASALSNPQTIPAFSAVLNLTP